MHRITAAILISAFATPSVAEAPLLSIPIDCALGLTCYIEDFKDADPGPGYRDYACGYRARKDHSGTDFALIYPEQFEKGVSVLASAPGIVTGVRDGMDDIAVTADTLDELDGKFCGNGVALTHGNGLTTQYCHLRKGSVQVRKDQKVERGQVLGTVGMSGRTNYPHVHLTVRLNDVVVDPFAPEGTETCADPSETGMWLDPLDYQPGGLMSAGFTNENPNWETVKAGNAHQPTLSADGPALLLFAQSFLAQPGDTLEFRIQGPKGTILKQVVSLEEPQARMMRYIGRKTPNGGWPKGTYQGVTVLRRDGYVLGARHTTTEIH